MTPPKRHADEVHVDEAIVRRLLRAQFPQWAELPLVPVEPTGTDHTIYRLGSELVVRMPIVERVTEQAVREARWLPFLAPQVPLELPLPVAIGEPGDDYPLTWSIVRWIEGEKATADAVDAGDAAVDLARFITALQACDPTGGPPAGIVTFGRGLPLAFWEDRLDPWIEKFEDAYDRSAEALAVLRDGIAAPAWDRAPVWFHGDLAWNLIARDRRLVGVIDSGYGIGDPACDLMPGWILFRGESRRRFFDEVGADDASIARSRAWVVAPSIIGVSYYRDVPHLAANAHLSLDAALAD